MHFDNSQGNFEELRQKEMAHVMHWKENRSIALFPIYGGSEVPFL